MQKESYKISNFLLERVLQSPATESSTFKLSWLLTFRELPNISLEYINFSDTLHKKLPLMTINSKEDRNILKQEIDRLTLLSNGNVIFNGILIVSEEENNKLMITLEEIIQELFSEERKNEYISEINQFVLVRINPKSNDFSTSFCKSFRKTEESSEIPLNFLKEEDIKEALKDYFFIFSNLAFEFDEKINEDFIENVSFARFKDSDIIVPVDKEKNIKYFELKTKNVNINNAEIVKDKWKAMLKQIKSDTKKKFEENFKLGHISQIIGKEIKLFFTQKMGEISESPKIELFKPEKLKSIVELQTITFSKTETDLKEILESHLSQIKREISLINKCLKVEGKKSNLSIYVFQNYLSLFPRKCIFSLNENNEISTEEKKIYYKLYDIPNSRALLRKSDHLAQSLSFASKNVKLKNVHLALNTKRIEGGKIYMIYGNYIYYHYCQDNFDDKGWGCAYRSLQSVLTWFIEQSYCKEFEIPTHKEIQQMLISMGDKPKEFLDSNEWIGAFEVNLILSKLLAIECKILHLSNGNDILTKVNELKQHFIDQGTPIMFGGGVLAFTLLGIDHNEKTGETNFLILDPHYTGSDNIKNIVDKGGISWKKPDMFLPNIFYNFCLPQKPNII